MEWFSQSEMKEICTKIILDDNVPMTDCINDISAKKGVYSFKIINGVKLAYFEDANYVIIAYAFLDKELRGQGLYKKALISFNEKQVAYQPSLKWLCTNHLVEEIIILTNKNGVEVSYLLHGTKKAKLSLPPIGTNDLTMAMYLSNYNPPKGVYEDAMKVKYHLEN